MLVIRFMLLRGALPGQFFSTSQLGHLRKLRQPHFLTILWAFFVIQAGFLLFVLGRLAVSKIRG